MKKTAVVAIGGIIGAYGRYFFTRLIVTSPFPWSTLLINYLGSALLIIIIKYCEDHPAPKWWWRPLLATGLCGGFTTYSSFAIQVDQAIGNHNYWLAISYPTASLIGTFLILLGIDEFLVWKKQK
jgi:CrcB protein